MAPDLEQEIRRFSQRFQLDLAVVEAAARSFLELEATEASAAAGALATIAEDLARSADPSGTTLRASQLQALAMRLESALARTQLIERSGEALDLSGLSRRLAAGRAMATALSFALGRQGAT